MLDPETHQPMNSFQLSDGTRHRTHSYRDTWEATNSGLWPSKTAQFTAESKEVDDDDSGICSPPLWTTSPPHSPQQHRKNHYRSLSPTSRTQAIVRGQRELMEMVRNMPESNYELSLKDLVEHHRVEARQGNNNAVEERNNVSVYKRGGGGGGGGGSRKGQVKRSGGGNVERGGFYLKLVFPFSFGSKNKKNKKKKKKKNESTVNSSSKVTPKPSGSDGSVKGVDKEWWKKSTSASRGSDSGASSINSGSVKSSGSSSSNSSSSRSNSRREKSGGHCWHFIRRPKRQTQK